MIRSFLLAAFVFINSAVFPQTDILNISTTASLIDSDSLYLTGCMKIEYQSLKPTDGITMKAYNFSVDSITCRDGQNIEYNCFNDTLIIWGNKCKNASQILYLYFSYALDVSKNSIVTLPFVNNDLTSYSLSCRTPNNYIIYSNYTLSVDSSSGNNYTYKGKTNSDIMRNTICIAPINFYNRISSFAGAIPVNLYYKDQPDSLMQILSSEIIQSIKYYNDIVGDYLHDGLNIVEDTNPDAFYINSQPGLIIASSSMIAQKYSQWSYHEVAHQWFGSGVYFYINQGWPISEPIAEMLKIISLEHFYGINVGEKYLNEILEEYTSDYGNTKNDLPIISSGAGRITYLKGPIIYSQLRTCLGEELWTKFLKIVYSRYKSKFLDINEFEELLCEIDRVCGEKFIADLRK